MPTSLRQRRPSKPGSLGCARFREPLLNNLHSVRDLVQWRDEVVRLEQRRDDGIRPLGDRAELLADADEAGRSAVRAGFAAWESLLAAEPPGSGQRRTRGGCRS